ncbi:MAG: EscU/YscU/HrcU family type III secretion system export apparatus switch protein, partial [Candidatus Zixiibacteriota bacterium]
MPEQDFQERTEKATTRRREKAREHGQVAKSLELNSAAVICIGFLMLYLLGPHLGGQIVRLMSHTMSNAPTIAAMDGTFVSVFGDSMLKFFTIVLPIFAVMTVVAFGVNVAQVGFKITPKAMEPRFDKLNLAKGI